MKITKPAAQHSYTADKPALVNRMKRIEGQAQGIRRMMEDDRYCIDIVQQLTSLTSAADEVALIILQNHIEGCVSRAIEERRGNAYTRELIATIRKVLKR